MFPSFNYTTLLLKNICTDSPIDKKVDCFGTLYDIWNYMENNVFDNLFDNQQKNAT